MTWSGRLRFIIGILITILIALGLTIYLNYSMSRVDSRTAQLDSDAYSVGIDYPSVIEQQLVNAGDEVKKNQSIFILRSPALQEAISSGLVSSQDLLYTVNKSTGQITIKASRAGTIESSEYSPGSFVPANEPIAMIAPEGSLYVSAQFKLTAPDYARIKRDSDVIVTLPDNSKLTAKVYDISLEKQDETVETVVKARLNPRDIDSNEFTVGTPVNAEWQLDNETWYNSIKNAIESLIRPRG